MPALWSSQPLHRLACQVVLVGGGTARVWSHWLRFPSSNPRFAGEHWATAPFPVCHQGEPEAGTRLAQPCSVLWLGLSRRKGHLFLPWGGSLRALGLGSPFTVGGDAGIRWQSDHGPWEGFVGAHPGTARAPAPHEVSLACVPLRAPSSST